VDGGFTKAEAQAKLNTLYVGVGYPEPGLTTRPTK